ncbi:MAG: DUF4838 domain-containing protein [Kiritimatiellia bacterium]
MKISNSRFSIPKKLRRAIPVLAVLLLLCRNINADEDIAGRLRSANAGKETRERSGKPVRLGSLAEWNIIIPADAVESERYSANQLRGFLKAGGLPELEIAAETARPDRHIFVGESKAMRESSPGFETSGYGPEDLRIVAADGNIVIAGGKPRGTLYGVYTFAEACLGIRFLTHDHTHIPAIDPRKEIGPLDRIHRPVLQFRGSYSGELSDAEFGSRLRFNALIKDRKELGGLTKYRLINHSFQNLLPTRRYGAEHPEWYAMRDGKRRWDVGGRDWASDGTEPCCSNPEVIKTITENTLKTIEKHPQWKNVSVSQNDNRLYCRCARCAEIDKEEESHMGSLLRLVNAVAEAVEKEYPEVMVGTLAYRYSREPPAKTRPRDNVQIQLCSIEACQFHSLDDPDCPPNARFAEDLRGWGEICDNIYVWHYVVNFQNYLAPCANYFHLGEDIRFLTAHGVKGIMAQGAWNMRGGEFAELRNYIIGHMMWDPGNDPDALLKEFVTLHYGNASGHIMSFLEYARDRALKSGKHPRFAGTAGDFGIDDEYIKTARGIFRDAMDAAENETVSSRVEKVSVTVPAAEMALGLDPVIAKCKSYDDFPKLLGELDPGRLTALASLGAELDRLMEKHDITGLAEGFGRDKFRKILQVLKIFASPDAPGNPE